jgi:hypothetical protein
MFCLTIDCYYEVYKNKNKVFIKPMFSKEGARQPTDSRRI